MMGLERTKLSQEEENRGIKQGNLKICKTPTTSQF